MKAAIVPIGNSRGVRIPKTVLEECNIRDEVTLEVEGDTIILRPLKRKPRRNWEMAFKEMRARKEDDLILGDLLDPDILDWRW